MSVLIKWDVLASFLNKHAYEKGLKSKCALVFPNHTLNRNSCLQNVALRLFLLLMARVVCTTTPRLGERRGSKQYIIGSGSVRAAISTGHIVTRGSPPQHQYWATRTKTNNPAPPRNRPRLLRWALRCWVKVRITFLPLFASEHYGGGHAAANGARPPRPFPPPRSRTSPQSPPAQWLENRCHAGWSRYYPTSTSKRTTYLGTKVICTRDTFPRSLSTCTVCRSSTLSILVWVG